MRLGTKILLLTLAATVGLAGLVIWIVSRDVTAHEVSRARRTIKWAVSGYFASVEERHSRDARLINLLTEESTIRSQLMQLEEGDAEQRRFAQAQLGALIFGDTIQQELTHAGISPVFHVLLNRQGELRFAFAGENADLAKALAEQSWPHQAVLGEDPLARRYLWINKSLYIALSVPIRALRGEDPTHACFVGYRVDDQWLSRLLSLVREDATRREESLAAMNAWFVVDGNIVARAVSSDNQNAAAALGDQAGVIVNASRTSKNERMEEIEFRSGGERFVGEAVVFNPGEGVQGILAVVNSLDKQLEGLRRIQRNIATVAAIVILVAVVVARFMARLIAGPIEQVVAGTQRIAAGNFETPLVVRGRDEVGQLAKSFNNMAAGLKQRDLIKDTFGKFVSPKLVEDFLTDPKRLALRRQAATVLMSDLENFAPMSEKLRPEDLVGLLNEYLGRAADTVGVHDGIVDKFIGDAVVAFWGPPFCDDHAASACRGALAMVKMTEALEERCRALSIPPLRVRIGISTGEVLAGIIGSAAKQDYTVIGDIANLASRLEGVNKVYGTQILASGAVLAEAKEKILFRKIDVVRVVGRSEVVEVYEVMGEVEGAPPQVMELREGYEQALEAYQQHNWSVAISKFEAMLQRFAGDGPSEAMAARSRQFAQAPPPASWDGVFDILTK
jgi:class 3 adenylate cyclase